MMPFLLDCPRPSEAGDARATRRRALGASDDTRALGVGAGLGVQPGSLAFRPLHSKGVGFTRIPSFFCVLDQL